MSAPRSGSGRSGAPLPWAPGRVFAVVLVLGAVAACGTPARPATRDRAPSETAPSSAVPSTPASAQTPPTRPEVEVTGATTGVGDARPGLTSLSVPDQVRCDRRSFATVTVSWSFARATSVRIAVDSSATAGPFGGAGSTTVRFPCDGRTHSYVFQADGPGGSTTATASVRAA